MKRVTPYNVSLNNVKIGSTELRKYGCTLDKDYVLSYSIKEELEQKYAPGRNLPYHIKKRDLPIEITIEFNFKVDFDFNTRYLKLKNFLNNSIGEILIFNNEDTGFKIYKTYIENLSRGIGQDKISIYFMLEPYIFNVNTKLKFEV